MNPTDTPPGLGLDGKPEPDYQIQMNGDNLKILIGLENAGVVADHSPEPAPMKHAIENMAEDLGVHILHQRENVDGDLVDAFIVEADNRQKLTKAMAAFAVSLHGNENPEEIKDST